MGILSVHTHIGYLAEYTGQQRYLVKSFLEAPFLSLTGLILHFQTLAPQKNLVIESSKDLIRGLPLYEELSQFIQVGGCLQAFSFLSTKEGVSLVTCLFKKVIMPLPEQEGVLSVYSYLLKVLQHLKSFNKFLKVWWFRMALLQEISLHRFF